MPAFEVRGRVRVLARAILALALILPGAAAAPPATRAASVIRTGCLGPPNAVAVADALLANNYQLASHPTVTLPTNPTWGENPFHDKNWLFNYHSLRFVLALTTAWVETGKAKYADRAAFLLADWYRDNPRMSPPSTFSWDEHSTAFRAMVYVCAAELLPPHSWTMDALLLHGRTLADSAFYRGEGNHALNQNIGLLEVGCRLHRSDWISLADDRTSRLVVQSVDADGATNEQSVFYELYNYNRYRYAMTRLAECGRTPGSEYDRIDRMPLFLAHATLPNGNYSPLGDTQAAPATVITGTPAAFAATKGASGPKPSSTSHVYTAGFAFVRTGWGEKRPFADETMLTMRFGPARRFHGHEDGTSITLYGYGRPLLLDGGQYSIIDSPFRRYFAGRTGHNVVTTDGLAATPGPVRLRWSRSSSTMLEVDTSWTPYAGVTGDRRVTFSRRLGYVVVDDRMTSTTGRTFRQLWHLREGTRPTIDGARVTTHATRGNLVIVQVLPASATRMISGATSPIQGWISYRQGARLAAPVVESRRWGTSVRFLTLLVPSATSPRSVAVTRVTLRPGGYTLTVTIGGRSERVTAGTTSSSIVVTP